MNRGKKRLGDLLVESGKISQEQLVWALKKQAKTGGRLGEILIQENLVSEDDVLTVLEIQLGFPRVHLEFIEISEEAVNKIPEHLARNHTIIPIAVEGNRLKIVMADPFNILALDDIRLVTGMEPEVILDTKKSISDAINKTYTKQHAEKMAQELSIHDKQEKKEEALEDGLLEVSEMTKDAPIVKLVDTIIENAVRIKASDIHIEPFEKYVRVRCRVDGELQKTLIVPKDSHGALITRIKILSNLNIAEKRIPQDGRVLTHVDGKDIDLRVSILPTVNGEKVVIRILARNNFLLEKSSLGLYDDDLERLERILAKPYGIVLVTGPTGSGKSTTLYTILNDLNKMNTNIITVEDPVEFLLDGINQVNVNTKAGMTFASGLRSILRQDPDIIMIGEIRDGETAEIAIRSAITGHVVLSTLHTNDAPSTIARLIDMGIEPYLVATSVNGVIAQRLVRKICPKCEVQYEASDYEKQILGIPVEKVLYLRNGMGCPHCNNTGYKGRIGIYEIMEVGRELRDSITRGETSDALRDVAIKNGMSTLRRSCARQVLKGVTTMEELVRVAYLKE